MASPRPVPTPTGLVEKNGSKMRSRFSGGMPTPVSRISARILPPSAHACTVTVFSRGVGIPPENLERIFDPFFSTKPVGVGTGLGLAICHGIVTSMHGEISVESTPGQGTCFRVVLPAVEDELSSGG
jgi:signal transduction histidine kinase